MQQSRAEIMAMAGGQIIDRLLSHYADVQELSSEAEELVKAEAIVKIKALFEMDKEETLKLKADLLEVQCKIAVNKIRSNANKRSSSIMQSAIKAPQ